MAYSIVAYNGKLFCYNGEHIFAYDPFNPDLSTFIDCSYKFHKIFRGFQLFIDWGCVRAFCGWCYRCYRHVMAMLRLWLLGQSKIILLGNEAWWIRFILTEGYLAREKIWWQQAHSTTTGFPLKWWGYRGGDPLRFNSHSFWSLQSLNLPPFFCAIYKTTPLP